MRTPRLPVLRALITLLLLSLVPATPAGAQFGGLGDAARRAKEALQKNPCERILGWRSAAG